MKVLVVGSGGREHAIAWKIAQSPKLTKLYCLPGNPGTAEIAENIPGNVTEIPAVVMAAQLNEIDLVVVGPEVPLSLGMADALQEKEIKVFGPIQAGAMLESSKAFSKDFMQKYEIPTAQYAVLESYEEAVAFIKQVEYPFVIKASGLAAGKGVFLPETLVEAESILKEVMLEKRFGDAGDQVVIEERISGPEVSVLAFTDGESYKIMPPAQDHKRLLENDKGPNTGGMGVFAPSPKATQEVLHFAEELILGPTIDGLRSEEIHYVGIIYAGLMLTEDGPKVLEFNCRFGDPETQVILPLLDSDLLEIMLACVDGSLDEVDIEWKEGAAACVVLASGGYPNAYLKGNPIRGLGDLTDAIAFHAGTAFKNGEVITDGGRVLGITATAGNLAGAIEKVYPEVEKVHFKGMQYRRDIGKEMSAYAMAGVDIEAGNLSARMIKDAVHSTYDDRVLSHLGSYGGLFSGMELKGMEAPVLVASTDGVGTKVSIAQQYNYYKGVGKDIVNHCIDDILVQGAKPLFFLDYFATSKLEPEVLAEIVSGMAEACKESGCCLIGGETAEMPGVYHEGHFDVAGTIVGLVDRNKILPRTDIQEGDILIGLPSTGPHTNGYSLIRSVFKDTPLDHVYPELGIPLGEALLASHKSYLNEVWPLLKEEISPIKAMAHLTGGGFLDNIPRILPENLTAKIDSQAWEVPALFKLIQKKGSINSLEMYRVFNMGIGLILVVSEEDVEKTINVLGQGSMVVGRIVAGNEVVIV